MKHLKSNNEVILIYTRPWFNDFYQLLGCEFEKIYGCKVVFFSDYEMPGVYNFSPPKKEIIKLNKSQENQVPSEYHDVIMRDRLLRRMDRYKALSIIDKYDKNIEKFFEKYKVKFVFSSTIDQFAIDLCYRFCILNSISFIGYHMSVIPGYTLLTSRGESNFFREADVEEITMCKNKIIPKNFRPDYIPKRNFLKISGVARFLKNLARIPFFFIKDLFSARFNYHYKWNVVGSLLLVRLRNIAPIFSQYKKHVKGDIFDIYIPLQFHPECNSDYWGRFSQYRSYHKVILDFCAKYGDQYSICVKEHPNMVGLRSKYFYSELSKLGVTIFDVKEDNRAILDSSKVTVTYNSSVGIEGLVCGASIYCMTDAYYISEGHLTSELDMLNHLTKNKITTNKVVNEKHLHDSISKTLSMSLPGDLPDTMTIRNKTHKKELQEIAGSFAENIKRYFEAITSKDLKVNEIYTYKIGD